MLSVPFCITCVQMWKDMKIVPDLQCDGTLYTNRRFDSWGTVGGTERDR